MNKKTVRDIDVAGKRVFLRVDYNVQFDDGHILDDYRLRESIPTLEYLIEQGAKIVICAHRGRPGGKVAAPGLSRASAATRGRAEPPASAAR